MFTCINLDFYVNNRGITDKDRNIYGEVDPFLGLSLPIEKFKRTLIHIKDEESIPFNFSLNCQYGDNLILEDTNLAVPKCKYTDIYLIGACNNGSFFHELSVYSQKGRYIYEFYMADFFDIRTEENKKNQFMILPYLYHKRERVNYSATLWFSHVKLKKPLTIEKIMFDYNPFIHIFAITMKKEEA